MELDAGKYAAYLDTKGFGGIVPWSGIVGTGDKPCLDDHLRWFLALSGRPTSKCLGRCRVRCAIQEARYTDSSWPAAKRQARCVVGNVWKASRAFSQHTPVWWNSELVVITTKRCPVASLAWAAAVAENFVGLGWPGLGFLQSASYTKPIPTHEKLSASGKSGPNAVFNLFFLGLSCPGVGKFVGFMIIFLMFSNPREVGISQMPY